MGECTSKPLTIDFLELKTNTTAGQHTNNSPSTVRHHFRRWLKGEGLHEGTVAAHRTPPTTLMILPTSLHSAAGNGDISPSPRGGCDDEKGSSRRPGRARPERACAYSLPVLDDFCSRRFASSMMECLIPCSVEAQVRGETIGLRDQLPLLYRRKGGKNHRQNDRMHIRVGSADSVADFVVTKLCYINYT